jgi:copper chaperone
MSTISLKIDGMTCGHCEQAVSKALQQVEGVERVEVSHAQGLATVEVAPSADPERLVMAVQEEGYQASVA